MTQTNNTVTVIYVNRNTQYRIVYRCGSLLFCWHEIRQSSLIDTDSTQSHIYLSQLTYQFYEPTHTELQQLYQQKEYRECATVKLILYNDVIDCFTAHQQYAAAAEIQSAVNLYQQPNTVILHQRIHQLCTEQAYDHTQIAHRLKLSVRRVSRWYYNTADNSIGILSNGECYKLAVYYLQHCNQTHNKVNPCTVSIDTADEHMNDTAEIDTDIVNTLRHECNSIDSLTCIRDCLQSNTYTAAMLSQLCGINTNSISNWFNGKAELTDREYEQLEQWHQQFQKRYT